MFGLFALVVLVRGAPQLLQQKPTVTPVGSVHEHVMVERIVITGRLIDRFANAIPGLSRADFRLRVDGKDGCIYEMEYCADLARLKTERAIEGGAYELVFRDPAATRGWHEVQVQIVRGNGIAAFQQWYRN